MSGRLWQIWTSSFSASTGDFVMYLGLHRAAGHSWGPSLLVQLPSQFPGQSFLCWVSTMALLYWQWPRGQQQAFIHHACLHCLHCIWGQHSCCLSQSRHT